jgi:hypothetical protein
MDYTIQAKHQKDKQKIISSKTAEMQRGDTLFIRSKTWQIEIVKIDKSTFVFNAYDFPSKERTSGWMFALKTSLRNQWEIEEMDE